MPRAKKASEVAVPEAVEEAVAPVEEAPEAVEEAVEEAPVAKSGKWPEVPANGRFQAVAHKGGFVVYNPVGQRASGVLSDAEANDLVVKMNAGASIK